MTKTIPTLIASSFCLCLAAPALAADTAAPSESSLKFLDQPGWWGVGVNIGNVETGVTSKVWLARRMALQAALGNRPEGNALRLNFDLTWSSYQWKPADEKYELLLYFGVGGALGHSFASGDRIASTEAGFRVPLGLSILIPDNPAEVFFEVAPEFTVRDAPTLGRYTFYADGAIGLRCYI